VATFGVDTLDQDVLLLPSRLTRPRPLRGADALGARPGAVQERPADFSVFSDAPGLFGGVAVLTGWREWQPLSVDPAALEAAAGPQQQTPAIVAYSLGNGMVIRVAVSGWGARLSTDPAVRTVTDQAWRLLSG